MAFAPLEKFYSSRLNTISGVLEIANRDRGAIRKPTIVEKVFQMASLPNRRWTFSLRTLFAIAIIGVICGVGWASHHVNERARLRNVLRAHDAIFGTSVSNRPVKSIPFLWSALGARPVGVIVVPESEFTEDELAEITAQFPEATIEQRTIRMDPQQMIDPPRMRGGFMQ